MPSEKKSGNSIKSQVLFVLAALVLVAFSGWVGYRVAQDKQFTTGSNIVEVDAHTAFVLNVYDIIKKEYWQIITDQQLSKLFQSAAQTMVGGVTLGSEDRAGVEEMVGNILRSIKPEQKDRFVTQLANNVLQNLQPAGRSSLYSNQDAQQLANTVNNIDPQVNLLEVLHVTEASTAAQVNESYQQRLSEIQHIQLTEEERQKRTELLNRARETLADEQTRQQYATSGVEPTFSYNLVSPDVVYLHLKQFSPTTPQDMQHTIQQLNQAGRPTSLILDLRGNVGGAIDTVPFLLSPFLGAHQYAYDFFKQGNTTQFRTSDVAIDELKQFKQIVVLVDQDTQSSAELMASVLKKYNTAIVVGTKTKGWGTVESVFPIEKQLNKTVQYSVFLVHSLTVREDNQAIEGNGVLPDIDITDSNWETELFSYYRNQELIDAVRRLTSTN